MAILPPEVSITIVVQGQTWILRAFKVDAKNTRMFWFKVNKNGSHTLDSAPRGFEVEIAQQVVELSQQVEKLEQQLAAARLDAEKLESLLTEERQSNLNNVACFEQQISDMRASQVTKDFINRNGFPEEPSAPVLKPEKKSKRYEDHGN